MNNDYEHLRELLEMHAHTFSSYIDVEVEELSALLDELDELRKENEGLRVDAERYSWLRVNDTDRSDVFNANCLEKLDKAIDDARHSTQRD